ncbi:hypothetical protein GCM10027615_42430 [Plantactinospora veratri]
MAGRAESTSRPAAGASRVPRTAYVRGLPGRRDPQPTATEAGTATRTVHPLRRYAMPRPIRRSAVVLAAALLTLTALAGPARAGTDTDLAPQGFAADSGDSCRYGLAEGTLEFLPVTAPPGLGSVTVTGTIADRPYERDPGPICRDDGLFSFVTFYAYGNGRLIAEGTTKVDNDITKYNFQLGPREPGTGVDTLVVQVCRASTTNAPTPLPTPVGYCGTPQVYSLHWS